jgi:hypothetical protein
MGLATHWNFKPLRLATRVGRLEGGGDSGRCRWPIAGGQLLTPSGQLRVAIQGRAPDLRPTASGQLRVANCGPAPGLGPYRVANSGYASARGPHSGGEGGDSLRRTLHGGPTFG